MWGIGFTVALPYIAEILAAALPERSLEPRFSSSHGQATGNVAASAHRHMRACGSRGNSVSLRLIALGWCAALASEVRGTELFKGTGRIAMLVLAVFVGIATNKAAVVEGNLPQPTGQADAKAQYELGDMYYFCCCGRHPGRSGGA